MVRRGQFLVQLSADIADGARVATDEGVNHRDEEERDHRGKTDAEDNDNADDHSRLGAGSAAEHERQGADDGGEGGHEDGAEALFAGIQDGIEEGRAFITQLIDELDDQDAVFCRETDEHDETDLAVDALVLPHPLETKKCTGHGDRNREHDGEWMNETLKLGGEHEECHKEREAEDKRHTVGAFAEFQGVALVTDHRLGGEFGADEVFEVGQSLAQTVAGSEVAVEGDGAQAVVAVEGATVGEFLEGDEIGEGDEFAGAFASDKDVVHVERALLVIKSTLDAHIVLLTLTNERGHAASAKERLQRATDVGTADAEIGGAGLVDADAKLRLCVTVIAIQTNESGVLLGLLQNDVAPSGEFLKGGAADDEFERLVKSPREALSHDDHRLNTGDVGNSLPHFIHHLKGVSSFAIGAERDDANGFVEVRRGSETSRCTHEHAVCLTLFLIEIHQVVFEIVEGIEHVAVGRAGWAGGDDEKGGPVFAGREFLGDRFD